MSGLLCASGAMALAVVAGACGSGGGPTVTHTTTVIERAPAASGGHGTTSSQQAATKSTSHAPMQGAAGGGQSWTMPDERGKDLQAAQDSIQALTNDAIWYTASHDDTGQGRHQILDRDWRVCSQTVKPGTKITPQTRIDFGVVRDSESCP